MSESRFVALEKAAIDAAVQPQQFKKMLDQDKANAIWSSGKIDFLSAENIQQLYNALLIRRINCSEEEIQEVTAKIEVLENFIAWNFPIDLLREAPHKACIHFFENLKWETSESQEELENEKIKIKNFFNFIKMLKPEIDLNKLEIELARINPLIISFFKDANLEALQIGEEVLQQRAKKRPLTSTEKAAQQRIEEKIVPLRNEKIRITLKLNIISSLKLVYSDYEKRISGVNRFAHIDASEKLRNLKDSINQLRLEPRSSTGYERFIEAIYQTIVINENKGLGEDSLNIILLHEMIDNHLIFKKIPGLEKLPWFLPSDKEKQKALLIDLKKSLESHLTKSSPDKKINLEKDQIESIARRMPLELFDFLGKEPPYYALVIAAGILNEKYNHLHDKSHFSQEKKVLKEFNKIIKSNINDSKRALHELGNKILRRLDFSAAQDPSTETQLRKQVNQFIKSIDQIESLDDLKRLIAEHIDPYSITPFNRDVLQFIQTNPALMKVFDFGKDHIFNEVSKLGELNRILKDLDVIKFLPEDWNKRIEEKSEEVSVVTIHQSLEHSAPPLPVTFTESASSIDDAKLKSAREKYNNAMNEANREWEKAIAVITRYAESDKESAVVFKNCERSIKLHYENRIRAILQADMNYMKAIDEIAGQSWLAHYSNTVVKEEARGESHAAIKRAIAERTAFQDKIFLSLANTALEILPQAPSVYPSFDNDVPLSTPESVSSEIKLEDPEEKPSTESIPSVSRVSFTLFGSELDKYLENDEENNLLNAILPGPHVPKAEIEKTEEENSAPPVKNKKIGPLTG